MSPKPALSNDHAADVEAEGKGKDGKKRGSRAHHKKRDFSSICAGHTIDDILNTGMESKHRISSETRETLEQMAKYLIGQLKEKIVLVAGRRSTVTLTDKIISDATRLLLPYDNAAELNDPSNNMLNHALAQITKAVYKYEKEHAPAKAVAKEHQKLRSLAKKTKENKN